MTVLSVFVTKKKKVILLEFENIHFKLKFDARFHKTSVVHTR